MRKAAASVQSICRPDSISAALVSATRPELLAQLQEIECCLAVALGHDLRCRRAVLLDRLGRTAESRAAFLEILKDAPDHADTLNAFGALLYRTGYRTAARSVFAQAVATHPEQPAGRVNLGNALRQAGDWEAARHEFTEALRLAPDFAQAHQGLGDLLAELGEHGAASAHWRLGYRDHALNVWTYRGGGQPVRVLMPISVANGNIAARSLLDDRVFEVTTLAMEFYQGVPALPPHDVVFNAIGDADLCGPALAATRDLLAARTTAPVVNHPSKVVSTGRAALAEALQGIDGIVVPQMACVPRAAILENRGAARLARLGFHFPLLLRAPGFHTGRHFLRVDTPAELAKAAAALPGYLVLAIEYLSGGWSDGKTRKGRVMFIDGRLYPLHWAVSGGWKVHYFTADMADNATHREEEKSFLRNMQGFLGKAATRSLAAISERLGLDYGGIDFGLSSDGKLHVFEANATMAIVPPPPDQVWDYRRPASDLALLAAQNMLVTSSTSPPQS
jgi:tetratricopeptide (TPR) repeat protein